MYYAGFYILCFSRKKMAGRKETMKIYDLVFWIKTICMPAEHGECSKAGCRAITQLSLPHRSITPGLNVFGEFTVFTFQFFTKFQWQKPLLFKVYCLFLPLKYRITLLC